MAETHEGEVGSDSQHRAGADLDAGDGNGVAVVLESNFDEAIIRTGAERMKVQCERCVVGRVTGWVGGGTSG